MRKMPIGDIAITAQDLVKNFGDFSAVNGISFQVPRGQIFGFLGPNGSGKTTTIRMMLGLIRPSSGSVEVLGCRVADEPEKIRPRVGYMSQRFSLYNDLTVDQNLTFYGKAYGLRNEVLEERKQAAVEMASLRGHEHTKTGDLAGGWRQRLALGATILHQPELVFLDEPTAGVDPLSRRAFWDLLYNLVQEKVTIFVTTHYMDEAEHCHRLAFIQRGKLIASGTPDEIKHDKMPGKVLEIAVGDPEHAMQEIQRAQKNYATTLEDVSLYGALIHVTAPNIEAAKADITNLLDASGIIIQHTALIEPSLEDVFIASMRP